MMSITITPRTTFITPRDRGPEEKTFVPFTTVMSTKIWVLPVVCSLNFVFTAGVALADAPLRPGDQIEMKIGGVPSTEITAVSGIYTVDGDGSVNLPHVGRVNIAGQTPGAAQSTIENAYKSRDIYTTPNVAITMQAQSRFINVGGHVKTPQRVPFTPDLTILSRLTLREDFRPRRTNERSDCFVETRA